ncbi:cupin domain-containing protein [Usitatibacter palustris]|uniref:Cupin type-2 domain-containing protein n=1 Tax=Usitatibacter palustris TaxID=2732487 RepID=A0A6M4H826_9PROT|nr:cupin domain-containing protein [Usitatibacter palustris]QJR14853.1 hypothetical protein DSM104440_01668 [Usitatibacter palustris]
MSQRKPIAILAADVPPRARQSYAPEPFASLLSAGRIKHTLGDLFGLTNFGVNITRIRPRGVTALRHAHTKQDEFIYVIEGRPTLVTNEGRTQLAAGMCAGFPAGTGDAHQLVNETDEDVLYLEVGDRTPGDEVTYPDDDLRAEFVDGVFRFTHKDGTPY